MNLDQRRIKLSNGQVYQIRPSFVMPYMIAKTDAIENALYLRRFGVPFDALAYVFGRDAMFWYRATISLGRNSLVGTTVKDPSRLPAHVVARAKREAHALQRRARLHCDYGGKRVLCGG